MKPVLLFESIREETLTQPFAAVRITSQVQPNPLWEIAHAQMETDGKLCGRSIEESVEIFATMAKEQEVFHVETATRRDGMSQPRWEFVVSDRYSSKESVAISLLVNALLKTIR